MDETGMEIISSERASLTSVGAPSNGKQLGRQLQAELLKQALRPQTYPIAHHSA